MYCIAYVAAAHGVHGEVHIKFCEGLTSAALTTLLRQKKIALYKSQHVKGSVPYRPKEAQASTQGAQQNQPTVAQVFMLDKVRPHKQGWLLKLADVTTRNQAESLIGWQWRVEKRLGLPELQSYQLLNKKQQSLGFIEDVSTHKDCVWLNIKKEEKTFLVPFVNSLVLHQDNKTKKIYMDLPKGLEELGVDLPSPA